LVHNFNKPPVFNKYVVLKILNKPDFSNSSKQFYVFSKSLSILTAFINYNVLIYKGNLFRKIVVNKYLVGYKFGEFTHTRKPFNYQIIKKKKKNLRR